MSNPMQEDFEAAVAVGLQSITSFDRSPLQLAEASLRLLQQAVFDLERITAIVQREIDTRLDGPVDTA